MNAGGQFSARVWITRGALLLGLVALGWALGRASAPAPTVSDSRPLVAGAGRTLAGVPVGFARSREGAAQAVAAYQRAFASPAILRPGVLRERIEAVAMPGYVKRMLAANSPGQRRISDGPIGLGLARGLETIYAAVPIGYRMESFSPDRARILTWGFTLLGNASTVEPAAYFGIADTELRWAEGRWQIARTRASFGPTPKLGTPPGPLGAYRVIGVARDLRSYELAP